jgi:hypothetical protein
MKNLVQNSFRRFKFAHVFFFPFSAWEAEAPQWMPRSSKMPCLEYQEWVMDGLVCGVMVGGKCIGGWDVQNIPGCSNNLYVYPKRIIPMENTGCGEKWECRVSKNDGMGSEEH